MSEEEDLQSVIDAARPVVPLPRSHEGNADFALALGDLLSWKLFRLNGAPVEASDDNRRLQEVTPMRLRTLAESVARCVRVRMHKGVEANVTMTMGIRLAQATISDPRLLLQLPKIEKVIDGPLPILRSDGSLALLRPGYWPERKVFILKPCFPGQISAAQSVRVLAKIKVTRPIWQVVIAFGAMVFNRDRSLCAGCASVAECWRGESEQERCERLAGLWCVMQRWDRAGRPDPYELQTWMRIIAEIALSPSDES